jgi:hypothetical protein
MSIFMELSPCEDTSRPATPEILNNLLKPQSHYRVHTARH